MPALDPLLIQSFPAPPTYIPPTPTSPNPPPSRPPSVPLPPLPGPSRILGQESFYISNGTRRPASKLSLASLDRSRPPSTFSPPRSPLVNEKRRPDDNKDILLGLHMDLNGALSDADLDTDFPSPSTSPSRTRHHRHHRADESISSIDMRDILAATAGSSDTEQDPTPVLAPSPSFHSRTFPFPAPPPSPPRSPPSPDIAAIISSTPRPSRSRVSSLSSAASIKYEIKRRASDGIRQKSKLKPRSSEPPLPVPRPLFESTDRRSWIEHDEFGHPLPLSESPLPVGDRNSVGTDEASHEHEETLKSPWGGRSVDKHDDAGSESDSSIDIHTPLPHLMLKHGLLSPRSRLLSEKELLASGRESKLSLASTKTNGTGLLKDSRHTEHRRTRHRDGRLLRGGIGLTTGLGWSDSEDEGAPSALTRRLSTLDLSRRSSSASFSHSPPSSRSSLSHSVSMRSMDSAHAPSSPLSHSASFSHYPPSSFSHRTGPLTRSFSSGTLVEYAQDRDDSKREGKFYDELDEWGIIDSNRWSDGSQTLLHPSNLRKSTSSSSSSTTSRTRPRKGSLTGAARSSGGISGVVIPEDQEGEEKEVLSATRPNRIATSFSNTSTTSTSTSTSSPSTASTLSFPLPITPQDSENSTPTIVYSTSGKSGASFLREKSLPPLPPSLRRVSGKLNLHSGGVNRGIVRSPTTPGAGTDATDLAARSTPGGLGRKTPTFGASPLVSPRPLRLASSPHLGRSTSPPQLAAVTAGQVKDRPAVPVPAALTSSMYQLRAPAPVSVGVKSVTSVPNVVEVKPKPRTGTGMVYRSGGPSKLRLPSVALGSSFSTGGVGGRVPGGISVPV